MPGHNAMIPVGWYHATVRGGGASVRRFDGEHASPAAWARRAGIFGFDHGGSGRGRHGAEQFAGAFDLRLTGSTSEQDVMAAASSMLISMRLLSMSAALRCATSDTRSLAPYATASATRYLMADPFEQPRHFLDTQHIKQLAG
jgi:hypothetical protein